MAGLLREQPTAGTGGLISSLQGQTTIKLAVPERERLLETTLGKNRPLS